MAKPAARDVAPQPQRQPAAPADQSKFPLRILLIVLIIGLLLGSAAAVGALYLDRLNDSDERITAPPGDSQSPNRAPTKGHSDVTGTNTTTRPGPENTQRPDQVPVTLTENRWVAISGAGSTKVLLGVSSDRLPARVRGFRPALGIVAPDYDFEIQQHEVSMGELAPWLAVNPDHRHEPPGWLPEADAEAFPATGVPWTTAKAYCESLGGALPTEVEWEYAVRGLDARSNPWGAKAIDLQKTHAFRQGQPLSKVMTNTQDMTAGGPEQSLFDCIGNALEWTADQYRSDGLSSEERFEAPEGSIFRAIRGFPPADEHPGHIQTDGAAYRMAQCAEGPCPPAETERLAYIGFRCVRRPADAPGSTPFPPEAVLPTIETPQKSPSAGGPPQKRRSTGPIGPNPYR
jgi:formylglycine-generating enzyme required for sulfatase activity